MSFHATRKYDLITFDEATPSKDWEDDFQTMANARSSPFKEDQPLWRTSTTADAGYNTAESSDVSAMKGLHDTLCRVERGLASVEKRMNARDNRLYDTVDELGTKLKLMELSQAKRDEELAQLRREFRGQHDTQAGLRDRDGSGVPSPPGDVVSLESTSNAENSAVTPSKQSHGGHSSTDNGEDELWTSLEKIDKLVKETNSGESGPAPRTSQNSLAAKPHIKPTPYDGSSSWDDYRAQFDLVAELNGWEPRTRAIYLAASLQGTARATLGDLDSAKRTDFEALTGALEARFGSQHRTEMFRAQLCCRARGREETLPELSQAIQRLTRQPYPAAPSTLQDTLARDHFIDALPDSEMRWRIHQARPSCLREALTTALEVEAFYVADRHRTQGQARAVLPPSADLPISEPEDDLKQQVGELRHS